MSIKDISLALLVITAWGLNFIFISLGLKAMPPLLFCALRFTFSALPAVFFIRRPQVPWAQLFGYGVCSFSLQFTFLFSAMKLGMSPGLAALVLQLQVFFTIGLSAVLNRDYPRVGQLVGALISLGGIGVVAFGSGVRGSLLGLLLTLFGAFSWASGNIFAKRMTTQSPLALVTWGNLMAAVISIPLALILEGPSLALKMMTEFNAISLGSLLYIILISTYFGYSLWNYLLQKYPAASVTPFTLLVPIVSLASSSVFLAEEMPTWKIGAAFLVISGLVYNIAESRMTRPT